MKRRDFVFVTLAFPAAAALGGMVGGCGGSGSGSGSGAGNPNTDPNSSRTRGKFTLTFLWPARGSRLIPAAANSIKVVLTAGDGTVLGTRLILGNDGPPRSSTETFDNLAPGNVTLTATAYPQGDGTGVAQATGAVGAVIQANQTTKVTLTMGSTIERVDVTPANPTIGVGAEQRVRLTATPKDAAGNVVLTFSTSFEWKTSNAPVANLLQAQSSGQSIMVEGAAVGVATLTVTENESGRSGSTEVTVFTGSASCVPGPVTGTGGPAKSAWPMPGHDNARTHRGGAGGATAVPKWSAWALPTEQRDIGSANPVIGVDGTVYFGNQNTRTLKALNPDNGSTRKLFDDLGPNPTLGSNGLLYVSNGTNLIAAEIATGAHRWISPVNGNGGLIALGADDTVYTGANIRNAQGTFVSTILALNGLTGAINWSTPGSGNPSLGKDGTVYIVTAPGGLSAIEGKCGTNKWTYQPPAGHFILSSPSIGDDGTLYVTTSGAAGADFRLYAMNPTTGTRKWEKSLGTASNPPSIGADGTLYMLSGVGKLSALDPASGDEKYTFTAPAEGAQSAFGAPAIAADNTVYFSVRYVSDGRSISELIALDGATGSVKWTYKIPANSSTQFIAPVVGPDGTVYLADDDNARIIAIGSND